MSESDKTSIKLSATSQGGCRPSKEASSAALKHNGGREDRRAIFYLLYVGSVLNDIYEKGEEEYTR
ncbi:hypothetical protein ACHAXM_010295 [Skeletonema potamos]